MLLLFTLTLLRWRELTKKYGSVNSLLILGRWERKVSIAMSDGRMTSGMIVPLAYSLLAAQGAYGPLIAARICILP